LLQRFGEIALERDVMLAHFNLQAVDADGTFSGDVSGSGQVDFCRDLVPPGAPLAV